MRRNKGFIIVTILAVAAVLTIMSGAFGLYVFYMTRVEMRHVDSVKAYYLATAGLQYGIARLTNRYDLSGIPSTEPPFTLTDQNDAVTVAYEQSGDILRIKSTANINGVTRTLSCELDNTDFFKKMKKAKPIIKWQKEAV